MFKFCPNCKSKLHNNNKRLIDCKQCGFYFYFNPSPTNALILKNEKNEILLVKKSQSPKKGQWDLPGGFVEFGETMEQSLKREIKEELNIAINVFSFFHSYCGRYPYKGVVYHPLCFVFVAKIKDEQIKKIIPSDDASEFRFFPKNRIPWSKIAFIDIRNALKDYYRFCKHIAIG